MRARYDTIDYINTYFPQSQRKSAGFASALFALAYYTELSGDLWRAQEHYLGTCELIAAGLKPPGSTAMYNNVSVLRLCTRQSRQLGLTLASLGPRPTRVTIAQSEEDPGPEEFLEVFEKSPSIEGLIGTNPVHIHAYEQAVERAERAPGCDVACARLAGLEVLARARGVSVLVERKGRVATLGLALDSRRFAALAAALEEVASGYDRVYGPSVFGKDRLSAVLPGAIPAADLAFIEAVIVEDALTGALLGPTGRIEVEDYPIYFGRRMQDSVGADPPRWTNLTMLVYSGTGLFSVRNAEALLKSVAAQGGDLLPVKPCGGGLNITRYCTLVDGLFARFLESTPTPGDAGRSTLRALIEKHGDRTLSPDETEQALVAVMGLPRETIVRNFMAFAAAEARQSGPPPSKDLTAAATAFAREFLAHDQ